MRPLPHVLAFADDRVAALDDLGIRAAAIAAIGPAAGLVARWPSGSTDQLATLAARLVALAAPPMATVLVTGRSDVALAVHAHGVILRACDISVADARGIADSPERKLFVLRSVHSEAEAEAAAEAGVDALIAGSIWSSGTHADRPAAGTAFLERIVTLGVPTFAIGGVTAERASAAKAAGAWGVAAITALWDARQPYAAALELAKPWM